MISIASDHAGFEFKEKIKLFLKELNYSFQDFGTDSTVSCDYPDFAHKVALEVSSGKSQFGILICGTGIGMSMTANKHKNIRAAHCQTNDAVIFTRKHNDANILCLGQRLNSLPEILEMVKLFLTTEFELGRHLNRINKINL